MLNLNDSPQYVKNVGPKRYRELKRLGIETVKDILYLFPRKYTDRTQLAQIGRLRPDPDNEIVVRGQIKSRGTATLKSGLKLAQALVGDGTGYIYCNWFNQPFVAEKLTPGYTVLICGKVQFHGKNGLQLNVSDYEIIPTESDQTINFGRIVPIYPLSGTLTQKVVRNIVAHVVEEFKDKVTEPLWPALLEELNLPDEQTALADIHFPPDEKSRQRARKKLAFSEFFVFQLGIAYANKAIENQCLGLEHTDKTEMVSKFIKSLPFELTPGQKLAMRAIRKDMMAKRPMNRLVQGDVGCGKTIVALCSSLIAIEGGFQAALMAPTETLASQHFENAVKLFSPLGLEVELLTGDVKGAKRKKTLARISQGQTHLVVGTHSLIQDEVEFSNLGLCVIDEQHKFGVFQRTLLQKKGVMPDFLMMTATPIPRSLAITLYGDMNLTIIEGMPKGRLPIKTYWIREKKLPDAYNFILKEALKGNQTYILYPLVEESDKTEMKAATTMVEMLRKKYFKDIGVGLVHGKLKAKEKHRVMDEFKNGTTKVLVSTTVVEVGIDVPNATIILIENAERFGLSQLHQLRGRIGRGNKQSYCILEAEPVTRHAVERMKTMEKVSDGFKIAQVDLKLRGPGEFFGSRQHGMPDFEVGDIFSDFKIMAKAKEYAIETVEKYPKLDAPELKNTKHILEEKYGHKFHFMRG